MKQVEIIEINTQSAVNSIDNLEKNVGDLTTKLKKLEVGTDDYNQALKELGTEQKKLDTVNRKIAASAFDSVKTFDNIGKTVAGLAGGFGAAMGAMQLFGVENENVVKSIQKLQAVMAIVQGVSQMKDAIEGIRGLKDQLLGASASADSLAVSTNKASGSTSAIASTENIGRIKLLQAEYISLGKTMESNYEIAELLETEEGGYDYERARNLRIENKALKVKQATLKEEILVREKLNTTIKKGANLLKGIGKGIAITAAISAAVWALGKAWDWVSSKIKSSNKELIELKKAMADLDIGLRTTTEKTVALFEIYAKIASDTTKGLDERKLAVEKMMELYPSYFKNLTLEQALNIKNTKAYEEIIRNINDVNAVKRQQAELDFTISELYKKNLELSDALQKKDVKKADNIREEIAYLEGNLKSLKEGFRLFADKSKLSEGDVESIPLDVKIPEGNKDAAKDKMSDFIDEIIDETAAEIEADDEAAMALYRNLVNAEKAVQIERLDGRKAAEAAELMDNQEFYANLKSIYLANGQSISELTELQAKKDLDIKRKYRKLDLQESLEMGSRLASATASLATSIGGIYESQMIDKENLSKAEEAHNKKMFEKKKKADIAGAYINMFGGIAAAFSSPTANAMGPLGWILSSIQAATVLTSGVANIANIKKQKYDGGNAGGSSITAPNLSNNVLAQLNNPTPVKQVGTDEQEQLNTKVYVLESDISNVTNKVNVAESEATF